MNIPIVPYKKVGMSIKIGPQSVKILLTIVKASETVSALKNIQAKETKVKQKLY